MQLGQDIDLSGGWKSVNFNGTLDGKGHTLSNIKLQNSGIFGTNKGHIKNLNLEFADQSINSSFFGAIAQNNFGTLENIVINGTLEITTSADATISGMVGVNNGGQIISCENRLIITLNATGNLKFGGFAGQTLGGTTIYHNTNAMQFSLNMTDGKEVMVGGMVGDLEKASNISQNANNIKMSIYGTAENSNIGGLAGLCKNVNVDNYVRGEIDTSAFESQGYVGGLVGVYRTLNLNHASAINHSYTAIVYTGNVPYGSLVGQLGGKIENSFGNGKCVAATISSVEDPDAGIDTDKFYPAEANFSTEIWKISEEDYPKFVWEE